MARHRWEEEDELNKKRRFASACDNAQQQRAKLLSAECRKRLTEAIKRIADQNPNGKLGLLLSGGVDSCAMLEASKCVNPNLLETAVTVSIVEDNSHKDGPQDELYAAEAVRSYNEDGSSTPPLKHSVVRLSPSQLIQDYARQTIQTLQLWGYMESRNSLIIAAALGKARAVGLTDVLVGDNADELFGGSYDCYFDEKYANDPDGWKTKRNSMADLPFVTAKLGAAYGITVHQPFADPDLFVEWALNETNRSDCITSECCVQSEFGGPWEVKNCGKLPLREAFCTVASWRRMDWIFRGSGASEGDILVNHYNTSLGISDDEFRSEQAAYRTRGVVIKTKEHLHNIRIFESINGGLHHPTKERYPIGDPRGCISCCFEIGDEMFCHLCDEYPAQHPKINV